jgi:hypothetical protein
LGAAKGIAILVLLASPVRADERGSGAASDAAPAAPLPVTSPPTADAASAVPGAATPVMPSAPPSRVATPTADEVEGLRVELERQRAELGALRSRVETVERARPSLKFSGFVQVDWVVHNQASSNEINDSNGTPLNQDRFALRRGHLRADAGVGILSGALEIDANTMHGPELRPIDAEVSLRWPARPDDRLPTVMATAGLMRIPFGYEVQELDWVRPFLERSTASQALFPGEYDLGVRLRAKYRFVDWTIAVMNGDPIGSKEFPYIDPVHQKELVGTLAIDVPIGPRVRLQAGISADTGTGFHPGTPTTKNTLVWQDENGDGVVQPNEVTAIPGSAATPSQIFRRFAVGGDVRLVVRWPLLGELTLRAQALTALNLDRGVEVADPVAAGRDLRELGWAAGITQEITRWAMIGARYDRYNPDADANHQQGAALVPVDRSYTTLALLGILRDGDQRLLVEYDVNSNPLGISAAGAPVTLADNALTVRAQWVF